MPSTDPGLAGHDREETRSPLVGVIMGSQSDWTTMKHAADTLAALGVPHEVRIVSAHRTPQRLAEYATTARGRGLAVIIAGAGGAAHLPGMCAAFTAVPVLGVPVESHAMKGVDSLYSSCRCQPAFPWAHWRSAPPGPPTRRCWPARYWPSMTPRWPAG